VQVGIRPRMLKAVVGKGNKEFATMRQQDALEFLQHLLDMIEKKEHASKRFDPTSGFKFKVEERLECGKSGKVKYTHRYDNTLQLRIPMEKVINQREFAEFEKIKKEKEEKGEKVQEKDTVRPEVNFEDCLKTVAEMERVDGFYSTAAKAHTFAKKTTRLASFPDHLIVALRKFVIKDGWVPQKLDVFVNVPDVIDLAFLRARGKQANEEELAEADEEESSSSSSSSGDSASVTINAEIVAQLMSLGMGFSDNRCKRAVLNTGNTDADAAMNWIFAHMDDSGLDDPIENAPKQQQQSKSKGGTQFSEEAIGMLTAMGFNSDQAVRALKATDGNLERAADWIFSHADDMETDVADVSDKNKGAPDKQVTDGSSKYQLVGIISHIGASTLSGHYVCHIKKEGKWVIYNDRKVAESENPPIKMAYLYFFTRIK